MNTTTMTAANAGGDPENLFLPEVGTTCIAVPHGTDWGFNSLDPAGVEIKGYDDDYVWMLANRTHYVTTLVNRVTFHPVQAKPERQPLTTEELLAGGWHTEYRDLSSAYVLLAMGVKFYEHPDFWGEVHWELLCMSSGAPAVGRIDSGSVKWSSTEIYRDGVHFYWGHSPAYEKTP